MSDTTRDGLREKIEKAIWIVSSEDIHEAIIDNVEQLVNEQVLAVLERLESKSVEYVDGSKTVKVSIIDKEKHNYAKQ